MLGLPLYGVLVVYEELARALGISQKAIQLSFLLSWIEEDIDN